jgi:hypothetical protein
MSNEMSNVYKESGLDWLGTLFCSWCCCCCFFLLFLAGALSIYLCLWVFCLCLRLFLLCWSRSSGLFCCTACNRWCFRLTHCTALCRLILLLSLLESLFELVGIYRRSSQSLYTPSSDDGHSLSLLAKRIASVSAVASPSVTSAVTFQTHDRSEPTLGASFMSDVTDGRRRQDQRTFHLLNTYIEKTYCSGLRTP